MEVTIWVNSESVCKFSHWLVRLSVWVYSFLNTIMATGAQKFKDVYEAAQDKVSGKTEEKDEEADEAADLLDKLKVESKSEETVAPEDAKEVTESKAE